MIAYTWNGSLQVISPEGGDPRLLASSRGRPELPAAVWPAWSRDSKTVYYKANDSEGRASFWSIPAAGGNPSLLVKFDVPSRNSRLPWFASDGRRFFFTVTENESDVWVLDLLTDK